MALVELQFRDDIFFDLFRAQIVRLDVPGLSSMLKPGRLVERIEAGQIRLRSPSDAIAPPLAGQLLVNMAFTVHETSLDDARAAGSLKRPATLAIPC